MGWFTCFMVASEEAQMKESHQIHTLEQARFALWRMDSAMAAMIAGEDTRSPEEYVTEIVNEPLVGHGEPERDLSPFSLLYFQIADDGKLTVPKACDVSDGVVKERLAWIRHLEATGHGLWLKDWERMPGQLGATMMGKHGETEEIFLSFGSGVSTQVVVTSRSVHASAKLGTALPLQQAQEDLEMRRKMVEIQKTHSREGLSGQDKDVALAVVKAAHTVPARRAVQISPFRSCQDDAGNWFLIRKLVDHGRVTRQGIWLDREKLTERLLQMTPASLPQARLRAPEKNGSDYLALAALPAVLEPGDALTNMLGMGNLWLSLGIAWACVLVAVMGVIGFAVGMVRLNEKRSVFVSAVTHELRTPLTAFNMYTEMLGSGLVPPGKVASYIETLRREAARLTHLVDNVLTYSRVEKKSARIQPEEIAISQLANAVEERISPRVIGAGMDVQMSMEPGLGDRAVLADLTAVEQIVYNLADNAVKYAHVPEGIVKIEFSRSGRFLQVLVRDSGKGIDPAFRKRLFQPFSRSAEDAAGRRPGVGLGLALSRELALSMKGNLKLIGSSLEGSCFGLTLPLASEPEAACKNVK